MSQHYRHHQFDDVPDTLEGEVLLERTTDTNGKPTGFVTASVAQVTAMKTKTLAELTTIGWGQYKSIVDAL